MLLPGPARLGAEAVRGPEVGAVIAEERLHHRLRAMGVGDEDGAVAVVEHPQPPVGTADPHPGLVGRDGGAAEQAHLDERHRGLERRGGGRQHVDERALADRQAEQVEERVAQPRQRDALDRAQIEHERPDVGPKRRAWLEARRRLGLEASGAARARAAVQRHARHVRLARRDLHPVVDLAGALLRPATHRPRRPGTTPPARHGGGSGWDGAPDGRRDGAWPYASEPRAATASGPSRAAGSNCPASWAADRAWLPVLPPAPPARRSTPSRRRSGPPAHRSAPAGRRSGHPCRRR